MSSTTSTSARAAAKSKAAAVVRHEDAGYFVFAVVLGAALFHHPIGELLANIVAQLHAAAAVL